MSLSVIVSLNRSRMSICSVYTRKKYSCLTKVQQCHLISDWMPSRWDISFKTERDLRHNPAQVAKNARFGDFDGFFLKANKYKNWESRAKNPHLLLVSRKKRTKVANKPCKHLCFQKCQAVQKRQILGRVESKFSNSTTQS